MKKITVLCVDDELGILKSLERCLSLSGYTVYKATDAQEGLKVLASAREPVDLLIIDQRMPGINGDEFLRLVREHDKTIPVIMLSGYVDADCLVQAMEGGAITRFLAKPWDNKELLAVVEELLHAKK